MYFYFFLLFISKIFLFKSLCEEGVNNCSKCNPLTKLCIECIKTVYIPDDKGGCENSKKCIPGKNYCNECNSEKNLCKECEDGYFPDENGGCTYTINCEISEKGKCLKCKENFILIGEENYFKQGIKICKSLNLEILKNCETINMDTGICTACKQGYYLGERDQKCSYTEFCTESIFGACTRCNFGYYLNKIEQKCIEQNGIFEHCKESLDGKTCNKCDDDYYFDENQKCIEVNYCLKGGKYKCQECDLNYYLTEHQDACTNTNYCYSGDKNLGICTKCLEGYYLDYKDGKCKLNTEDNDFKYCEQADNDKCNKCIRGFELGNDNKCSTTKYCTESVNGKCIECLGNYYLGLDNKCTDVEHCIYSDNYRCEECEDNYFYDINDNICKLTNENFKNCKTGYENGFCYRCKDDYYLHQIDNLCHSNKEYGTFYKCEITDPQADHCIKCIEGYYLGLKDYKCNKVEGCIVSENENKCIECDSYFCLDVKTGQCLYNRKVISEDQKYYYRCNQTNEEGNACEICSDGYTLNENGLCIDYENCEEYNEKEKCKKCNNYFCLNEYFGCQEVRYANCLECNDIFNLWKCTKCYDDYELNEYSICEEKKKNEIYK